MIAGKPLELRHRLPPEGFKHRLQNTEAVIEHAQQPHIADGHCRDNVRHVNDHAEEFLEADTLGQDNRQDQSQAESRDAAPKPQFGKGFHRHQKQLCMKQLDIVGNARPGPGGHRATDGFHVEKAHDHRTQHGVDKYRGEQDHSRRHENKQGTLVKLHRGPLHSECLFCPNCSADRSCPCHCRAVPRNPQNQLAVFQTEHLPEGKCSVWKGM